MEPLLALEKHLNTCCIYVCVVKHFLYDMQTKQITGDGLLMMLVPHDNVCEKLLVNWNHTERSEENSTG